MAPEADQRRRRACHRHLQCPDCGAASARPSPGPELRAPDKTSLDGDIVLDADPNGLRGRAVGLMTAGIAHDLGNMLHVAGLGIRALERKTAGASCGETQVMIASARAAIERAGALTRRLLEFAGPGRDLIQRVDPRAVVSALEELLRWTAGPDIRLEVELSHAAPTIACDRHELENAVLNLVINARDAMPAGGRLTIRACAGAACRDQLGASPDHFVLSVSDEGVGMPPEVMARIFEPYFTTKSANGGVGLGLSRVKAFAVGLHGVVEVESFVGCGTTVTLRIPERRPD